MEHEADESKWGKVDQETGQYIDNEGNIHPLPDSVTKGTDRSWYDYSLEEYGDAAADALNDGLENDEWFGKSGSEINAELEDAFSQAKQNSDNAWQAEKDLLTQGLTRDDGSERTLASSLNQYDKTMDELSSTAESAVDAQDNYGNYMNPYTQQQIDTANEAIQGASGAKLQSSATQNAIASNTASMQGSAYNNAVSDALTDASNTLSNVNTQSQVAGDLLTADSTPEQDIINMNNDWANENLETAVGLANTEANTESNTNGVLGNFNQNVNTNYNTTTKKES